MATHTTYYNLTKPSSNDKVNIGVLNDNADIIDTALHDIDNTIDNLDADDIAYGSSTVKDALDGLTANTFGTAVNISGYVENNKYTFPSDGYVELKATSSGAYVVVNINGMISIARSAYSDYVIIYVRKGMEFYKTTSYTGTYFCTFYPLV